MSHPPPQPATPAAPTPPRPPSTSSLKSMTRSPPQPASSCRRVPCVHRCHISTDDSTDALISVPWELIHHISMMRVGTKNKRWVCWAPRLDA
eukprot:scaffold9530_cov104-Isochrysis_galbana.AAC.6